MEESPIIDSPEGNRPNMVLVLLSGLAILVGLLGFILGLRNNGSINRLEMANNPGVVDNVSKAQKEQTEEIAALKLQLGNLSRNADSGTQHGANLRTFQESTNVKLRGMEQNLVKMNGDIGQLAQRVGQLTARPPQQQPRPEPGAGVGAGGVRPTPPPLLQPPVGGIRTADITHIIKKGDNFVRLAAHYGVSVQDIEVRNPSARSDKLSLGQKLIIPPQRVQPPQQRPVQTPAPRPAPAQRPVARPAGASPSTSATVIR